MKVVGRIMVCQVSQEKKKQNDLTCDLNQICSGHVLGVGANSKSQRWTQDTAREKKKTDKKEQNEQLYLKETFDIFGNVLICFLTNIQIKLTPLLYQYVKHEPGDKSWLL